MGQDRGRLSAQAFERLFTSASLVDHLVAMLGLSESRARAAIGAAKWFMRENYFIINGVVHRKLECYAGSGTQIDQLNADCLAAITKHLKVDDVVHK